MPQFIDRPEQAPPAQETPWTRLLVENRDRGAVLYYFSSESCKFCNDASPWIDLIEEKYRDQGLVVLGVDTQRSPAIAGSAGVTGVPVLIMTQDGDAVNRVVGWSNGMDAEIESNLGLLDLYGKKPGLRAAKEENAGEVSSASESTCEGCNKEENPAVAELAANVSAEIQQLRASLEEIKSLLALKADK